MKGKKCGLLLALFTILWSLLSVYSDARAVSGQADANRFLYAVSSQYSTSPSFSDPKRYNEYVTYAEMSGAQMNTYPGIAPNGQYVSISGKMNISFLDRTNQYYPYVTGLYDLTVVCGWGGVSMVTDGASVSVTQGHWDGIVNNTQSKVTYLDASFNWSGHFTSSYSSVSSGALLSCTIRRKTARYPYYEPFAVGTLNNTYVYASNSSYDSYLSFTTSNEIDVNALKGISDAVVNLQNSMTEQNNVIINQNQTIINQDNEDRENIEQQSDSTEQEAQDAGDEATQTGTSLFGAFTQLLAALTNVSGNSCTLPSMQVYSLNFGSMNLCQYDIPPQIMALVSIGMVFIIIPLGIHLVKRMIGLYKEITG